MHYVSKQTRKLNKLLSFKIDLIQDCLLLNVILEVLVYML